jgi:hypothetical protein
MEMKVVCVPKITVNYPKKSNNIKMVSVCVRSLSCLSIKEHRFLQWLCMQTMQFNII